MTTAPQPPCQRNKIIITIEVSARKTGGIKLFSVFYFAFALISELDRELVQGSSLLIVSVNIFLM